jgi:hypothetical protein
MKIGLSYSRCVRDIVDGHVDIHDVLVIIARTDFDPYDDAQWKGIWTGYGGGLDDIRLSMLLSGSNPEWMGYGPEDEDRFRQVSQELWSMGKLHQPRKFGAPVMRRQEIWLETILPSEELEQNPVVKKAWDNFQVVAGLTNTKLDKDYY